MKKKIYFYKFKRDQSVEVCKTTNSKFNNLIMQLKKELAFYIELLSNFNDFNIIKNLFRGNNIEIQVSDITVYKAFHEYFENKSFS